MDRRVGISRPCDRDGKAQTGHCVFLKLDFLFFRTPPPTPHVLNSRLRCRHEDDNTIRSHEVFKAAGPPPGDDGRGCWLPVCLFSIRMFLRGWGCRRGLVRVVKGGGCNTQLLLFQILGRDQTDGLRERLKKKTRPSLRNTTNPT